MSIRFKESDLRDQGRATVGVTGMRFGEKDDCIKTIAVVDPSCTLLVASEEGIGKRTPFDDYRLQSRGGSGVIAIKSEAVAGALSVHDNDEIMLLTAKGQSVRCPVKDIRLSGRNTQGVKLLRLAEGDRLLSIARIVETEEEGGDAPAG
jgi:DNA gyrase subunit A